MALAGLQNYTFPLTLLGEVTIGGDLNCNDVFVSGTVTGAGIGSNILPTDNEWTGTNDFQNTAFSGTAVATNNDMLTKEDVDDLVTDFNPLGLTNAWQQSANFTICPILPIDADIPAALNQYIGYTDMVNTVQFLTGDILIEANEFSGINTFSGTIQADTSIVPSLLDPTGPQQAASKGYVDGKIELAGKAVVYSITTPGTYNFNAATLLNGSLANVGKIDYWLFSGSCSGASGSVVSGTIGNGSGVQGSLLLTVGTIADPAEFVLTQESAPSSSFLLISNQKVANVLGACNLGGVITAGIVGTTDPVTSQGLSANGQVGANNILASNVLGTTTSAGGCLFVAYYI